MSKKTQVLIKTEKILKDQRGFIAKPPTDEEVVFLATGGLDSTCGIAKVIEEYNCKVYPLFVRRSAKATKFEEEAFDKICVYYKERYGDNLMTPEKVEVEVPPVKFKKGITVKRHLELGHALRNSSLQNIGVQYAVHLNDSQGKQIKTVFAGSVEDDLFPHNFIEAFRIQTLLTCWDLDDWDWQVLSPFIDEYLPGIPALKKDLIVWAMDNDIPLQHTRTCTSKNEISCGVCGECTPRLKAFKAADRKDPIEYSSDL